MGVQSAVVDGRLIEGDVEIEGGRVAAVGVRRRGRGIAIPALVDVHINGYAGIDFSTATPDEYRIAERKLLTSGVGAYLPTIITADEQDLRAALRRAQQAVETWAAGGARPLGVHLEGPFLSVEFPGVHPVVWMLRFLCSCGVVVSCGHSNASYAQAIAGFDAGATAVTHLFNAMHPILHRDPGIAVAALLREDIYLNLIADHEHLSPEILEIVRRLAPDRICLVTDAVAAAAARDGVYQLGHVQVERTAGRVRSNGKIGGGTTPLIDCVRNFVNAGANLEWAVTAASTVPARLLGVTEIGSLRPGRIADVVVVDESLVPSLVFSEGREYCD